MLQLTRGKPKSNTTATIAPTINDDVGDGYSVGSLWIIGSSGVVYICTDAALGSAAWVDLSKTDLPVTAVTDPAINAAVTTAIIDSYSGVIVTLTGAGNAQTLQNPTDLTPGKRFTVVGDDGNGAFTFESNGITISAGEAQRYIFGGSVWIPVTAIDADDIAAVPHGDISAIKVQTYLNELEDEKIPHAAFTAADEVMVGTGAGTHGQITLAASQFLAKGAAGAAGNKTATEARAILNVADGADVTADNAPKAHKASHTDGTDDIQSATAAQKGVATAAQITKLDAIEALADVTSTHETSHADVLVDGDIGVTAGKVVQVDQAVTAWTRAATTVLGTSLNGTLSDTSEAIAVFNGVAGVTYHCRCLGAGAITHAAGLLITQTGASIAATAAGDTFDVEMITSTTCRIKNYLKADGTPIVIGAVNVETLSGTRTLVVTDKKIQWLDPGGADRDVPLPAEASSTNLMFIILNTADGAGEDLLVKNAAAATKATLGPGMMGMFSCDGTNWKWENATDFKTDVIAHQTILPLSNTPATPTLAFGDGDSGLFETSDDNLVISINGVNVFYFNATRFTTGMGRSTLYNYLPDNITPNIVPLIDDADTGIGWAAADALSLIAGGVEGHRITEAAGAITHTLTGEVQGATYSNQMVNLASSQILGLMTDARFLNLLCENPAGGVMTDISMKGHDGTYQGAMTSGDRINKGSGWALDFDGTNDYIDLGDSDDFSFGDGTNDSPFTVFGLIQVVDGGVVQEIISKIDLTTGSELREWSVSLSAAERIYLDLYDESANAIEESYTTTALSIGWHTFAISYSGVGGVGASNGITMYIDGIGVGCSVVSDGTYVAMENLTTPVWIGANEGAGGTPTLFMQGDIAHVGCDAVEWSAMDAYRHWLTCRGLYNL